MSLLIYGTIRDGVIVPNNKKEVLALEGKEVSVKIDRKTFVRTDVQNAALHLYFEMLADALNGSGNNVQKVLKQVVDLDWTSRLIKEVLWRPIQIALIGKQSTTNLDKVNDIGLIYDHINRYLSEKFYLHVEFPHDDGKKVPAVTGENYPKEDYQPKF